MSVHQRLLNLFQPNFTGRLPCDVGRNDSGKTLSRRQRRRQHATCWGCRPFFLQHQGIPEKNAPGGFESDSWATIFLMETGKIYDGFSQEKYGFMYDDVWYHEMKFGWLNQQYNVKTDVESLTPISALW